MSEPDSYDLSEAAVKELYRDLHEDTPKDVSKLIHDASVLIGSGAGGTSRGNQRAQGVGRQPAKPRRSPVKALPIGRRQRCAAGAWPSG